MATVHKSKSGTKYASRNIGRIERVLGPGKGEGTDGYKIEGGYIPVRRYKGGDPRDPR